METFCFVGNNVIQQICCKTHIDRALYGLALLLIGFRKTDGRGGP
jgi:hypothetical protein